MTENLQKKRKNVMEKIHNFKIIGKNFSFRSYQILFLKVFTLAIKIPFYLFLIRKCEINTNVFSRNFFRFLLGGDLILSFLDLFEIWSIFSYIKLSQDVIDDYRMIEKMQKEICDLEIEIKTKKESLSSI